MKIIRTESDHASWYGSLIYPFLEDEDDANHSDVQIYTGLDEIHMKPCLKIVDTENKIIGERLTITEVNQLAAALSTAVGDMLHIKKLIKQEKAQ